MEPYGKRLHKTARKEFRGFWSDYRYWVLFASAGLSPVLIQITRHGIYSMVNIQETLMNGLVGFVLSLLGSYIIAIRKGAETLDAGLLDEVSQRDKAITELNQDIQRLKQSGIKPALTAREQGDLDSMRKALQGASHAELCVLNCILDHGEIEAYQLEKAIKDRDAIASSLEKWLHKLIGERVEQGTNRTSYFIVPGRKAAFQLALNSQDQPG